MKPLLAAFAMAASLSPVPPPATPGVVPAHPDPRILCRNLTEQADRAAQKHAGQRGIGEALAMRDDGRRACREKRYYAGVASLYAALLELGVEPHMFGR